MHGTLELSLYRLERRYELENKYGEGRQGRSSKLGQIGKDMQRIRIRYSILRNAEEWDIGIKCMRHFTGGRDSKLGTRSNTKKSFSSGRVETNSEF